ncbi:hypothetical protein ANCDUO_17992 [Ancylostoma duodenale]|uniref:BPL/LPL catalytic domain-containing protein n=1 Tax=Ancylostoma duodenale TaxID=51022 RepID=A0A0C2FZ24_9BILA|nr:hypothetical protein ANCDUO_17992 [Ancylostoma duodenale]
MELQPGSRKCSGTAARITTARAYHHLTLLVNADLLVLSTSLRSPYRECVVTDVDVDEELKKNKQVVENLSFLKDWNWIFGKTPKFWFENGSRKQYVEAGIIKECSLGQVGERFD